MIFTYKRNEETNKKYSTKQLLNFVTVYVAEHLSTLVREVTAFSDTLSAVTYYVRHSLNRVIMYRRTFLWRNETLGYQGIESALYVKRN